MPSSFISRTAQRQKAKLRVGLSGPSGSGKTYSALLLAKGLVGDWKKVAIIDTEQGSAELYSNLGDYQVIPFETPYSAERYVEAIAFAESLPGVEIIIIDSVSHEWEGAGGATQTNELLAQSRFKGNSWAAWSQTTPRHQKFIDRFTTSKCHVITTARSKVETIQVDGKVKKVGMKDIQREGFEYELTLNFNIDREQHHAMASKDRTGLFIDKDPFIIDEKTGKALRKWADSGIEPIPQPVPVPTEEAPAQNQAQRPAPTTTARPPVKTTTTRPPAKVAPKAPAVEAKAEQEREKAISTFDANAEAEAVFGGSPGNTPDPNVIHDEEVDGYLQLIENLVSSDEALKLYHEVKAKTVTENQKRLLADVIAKGQKLKAEGK